MNGIERIAARWLGHMLIVLAMAGAVACSKDGDEAPPVAEQTRTVLIYLAADNNLDSYAKQNIKEMAYGSRGIPANCDLVVYVDPAVADPENGFDDSAPRLLHFGYGDSEARVLKIYPEQNSASPEVLASVIDDACSLYPAESYGLILWSHGEGWQPKGVAAYQSMVLRAAGPDDDMPPVKWFGMDGTSMMDVGELQQAIPDGRFRYIIFDACFMGGVEVAYALRDKAQYIIGSPAEVIATGFPYNGLMPALFGKESEREICRRFFDYYNGRSGSWRTATVGLVRTSELEALAGEVRAIVQGRGDRIAALDLSAMQSFSRALSPLWQFDLDEFMESVATPDQYARFSAQLARTVPYAAATPMLFDKLPVDRHCGVASYIFRGGSLNHDNYYKTLEWYKSVYE
ncbi:MAG: hypothetical protein IJC16_06535 [Rikenellaceae bacterium]|nr:hypothetical protein [Rikenellaceae bacterium]